MTSLRKKRSKNSKAAKPKSSQKSPRVVVLGGSGFIGSALINKLWEDGHRTISSISAHVLHPNTSITQKIGDIADRALLSEMIGQGDTVIHVAESVIPATSELNRGRDLTNSLGALLNVLDVCVEKKVSKFIFVSSGGAIYGNGAEPKNELSPTDPLNSYGVLKLASEKYINLYGHLYNLRSVIVRPSNAYGRTTEIKNFSAIDTFLRKIINNEIITIWGDGKLVRDYIHINDLVDFLRLAIKNDAMSGVYNVGTNSGTSLVELIDIIETVTGKRAKIEYKAGRPQDVRYNVLDIKKIKKLGWKPKFTVKEGIIDIYRKIKK